MSEVAVHVRRGAVPGIAGIDHNHRPTLAAELKRRGKASGRTADNGDVAVPLDRVGDVFVHADDATAVRRDSMWPCRIRKTPGRRRMTELAEIEQVVRTRLRSLRTTLGYSLDDLAARANLSPSTISRVETGKAHPTAEMIIRLADQLVRDLRPLNRELHTWARYELAGRYGVPVPEQLPADGTLVYWSDCPISSRIAAVTCSWL
jgi:transcriptional regulator with XRE-family HTH domain